MLREDKKAGFLSHQVYLFWTRWTFVGTGVSVGPFKRDQIDRLNYHQNVEPVRIGGNGMRTWWWFEGRFYWEDEHYGADDVVALVRDRQRKKDRQLQRAKDLMVADEYQGQRREPITEEMRRAVYTRDGGRCVNCGSQFNLQYDHILPVALGGATTIENLQLLCSDCNRRKSDSI